MAKARRSRARSAPEVPKSTLVIAGNSQQARAWIRRNAPELSDTFRIIVGVRHLYGWRRENVREVKLVGEWWNNDLFNNPEAWFLLSFLDPTLEERLFGPQSRSPGGSRDYAPVSHPFPAQFGRPVVGRRSWSELRERKKPRRAVTVVGSVRMECEAG